MAHVSIQRNAEGMELWAVACVMSETLDSRRGVADPRGDAFKASAAHKLQKLDRRPRSREGFVVVIADMYRATRADINYLALFKG
jgi:hypothetical protein